jgi:hypothetical protein
MRLRPALAASRWPVGAHARTPLPERWTCSAILPGCDGSARTRGDGDPVPPLSWVTPPRRWTPRREDPTPFPRGVAHLRLEPGEALSVSTPRPTMTPPSPMPSIGMAPTTIPIRPRGLPRSLSGMRTVAPRGVYIAGTVVPAPRLRSSEGYRMPRAASRVTRPTRWSVPGTVAIGLPVAGSAPASIPTKCETEFGSLDAQGALSAARPPPLRASGPLRRRSGAAPRA